jgi:NAD(P)-dependent dehydrogenase (short-subunit alcohol dehydrogenase family)
VADINLAAAEETVSLLDAVEGGHIAVELDVTDAKSVNNMVQQVTERYGKIDFLSNHAGLNIRKPAVEFTEQEWDKVCDCNLKGIFLVAQAVGRQMLRQKFGRIVNTASVSAARGHKNLAVYAATKGGIAQLTKVLAHEWALEGITVNAIGPGYVKTNQTAALLSDPVKMAELQSKVPMGRLGEMEEMVGPILFLCSPLASYITGTTLYVEGGRLID